LSNFGFWSGARAFKNDVGLRLITSSNVGWMVAVDVCEQVLTAGNRNQIVLKSGARRRL